MSLPRVRAAPSTTSWAACTASRAADRSASDTGTAMEATQPRCLPDLLGNAQQIAQTPCCHTLRACLAAMEIEPCAAIQRRQHSLVTLEQAANAGLSEHQVHERVRRG